MVDNFQNLGFYQSFNSKYGEVANKQLKTWINLNKKLTRCRAKRRFLLSCREYDVKPPHIVSFLQHFISDEDGI